MEAKEHLFKNQNPIEEEEKDKNPIETQKEEIAQLRAEFNKVNTKLSTKSTKEGWQELHAIGAKLGQKYLDLAKFIAKESNTKVTANIQSLVYIAEASKFNSQEAIQTVLFQIKDLTLFLNTFLLMLDKTPALTANSLATIWTFLEYYPNQNSLAGKIWEQLQEHFSKFFIPLNITESLRLAEPINPKELTTITTNFLAITLDPIEPNIETIYQLIQFSKDEQLISTNYIQAYVDYFFQFAKKQPENFVALPFYKEIIYFISEIYFNNNEILKDIECLHWLKENQLKTIDGKNTIPDKTFNEIFYDRIVKCCEKELFIVELLQYFKEISKDFSILPTDGLLSAIKTIYYSGSLENIILALALTTRICAKIPAEFSKSSLPPEKSSSINGQFIRFYKVCFQPDSILSLILPARLQEIKNYIESKYKLIITTKFFKPILKSDLLKNLDKLRQSVMRHVKPIDEWSPSNIETKKAEAKTNFESVLSDLVIFQSYVENIEDLKQLFIRLRIDMRQILNFSPVFENQKEKEENELSPDNLFDPSNKESKEEGESSDVNEVILR